MNFKQIYDMEDILQEAFDSIIKHKNRPEKKTLEQALKIIDDIIWNWRSDHNYSDREQGIKDLKYMIKKTYHYVTNAPYGKDSPAKQKIEQAYLIMQDSKNEDAKEFLEEFSTETGDSNE